MKTSTERLKRLALVLVSLAVALPTQASAQAVPAAEPGPAGFDPVRLARIDSVMHSAVSRGEYAGIVWVVMRDGKLVELDSAGVARLDSPRPAGARTLFRIASMTKALTSVGAMILVEEGRLRLGDRVSKYLPEFRNMLVATPYPPGPNDSVRNVPASRSITIRHLLTHTSGITYAFADDGPVGDAYRTAGVTDGIALSDISMEENVRRLAGLPLVDQPGQGFHYGLSVDVLGRVIEVVTGQRLGDFLEERVFRPLGMHDTGFLVDPADSARMAGAYTADSAGKLVPMRAEHHFGNLVMGGEGYWGSATFHSGGAGAYSTALDYARFLHMIVNGGELDGVRILSPATVELIGRNALPPGNEDLGQGYGFGLGFQVLLDPGVAGTFGSPGLLDWGGIYGTSFWADPEEKLVGVLMLQRFPQGPTNVAELFQTLTYAAMLEPAAAN